MLLQLFAFLFLAYTVSAAIPALPNGWSYLGCMFEGNGVYLLSEQFESSSDMTISKCVSICSGKGNTYAGLQNTNQCSCSNTLAMNRQEDDKYCSDQCAGDRTQPCGKDQWYTTMLHYVAPPPPPPPPPITQPTTPPLNIIPSYTPPAPVPTSSPPPQPPLQDRPVAPSPTPATAPSGSNTPPGAGGTASSSSSFLVTSSRVSGTQPIASQSAPSSNNNALLEITQYLRPSPSLPSGAAPNQFSGTGLYLGSGTSSTQAAVFNRFENRTIVLLGPAQTAPPRLRDESQMIVFGTYMSAGSPKLRAASKYLGPTLAGSWVIALLLLIRI